MPIARMLHNKISLSIQVSELSIKAQILFTWMIPHADDDGRLLGDAKYIKAKVVPLQPWSISTVEKLLIEIKSRELINRWVQNDQTFIEFPTWLKHQHIRKDRYTPSILPTMPTKHTHASKPYDNQVTTQYSDNEVECNYNKIQVNTSEDSTSLSESPTYKEGNYERDAEGLLNPKTFNPKDAGQTAAKKVWESLEPRNPMAFTTTYYKAYKRGLPEHMFYQFESEIRQDKTIDKKGAVFNTKVEEYFSNKEKVV